LREVVVTLKDGVKETIPEPSQRTWKVDNVIKETHEDAYHNKGRVEGVIRNGIKETQPHVLEIINPINFEPTILECKRMNEVNNVLEKGIKETRAMDEWVNTENIINKVIDNGIKETKGIEPSEVTSKEIDRGIKK
jgi:methylaspartate ammonia-lyase